MLVYLLDQYLQKVNIGFKNETTKLISTYGSYFIPLKSMLQGSEYRRI